MLPQATDNAVADHMRPAGLWLDHTGLGYGLWHLLKISHWTLKTGMICAKKSSSSTPRCQVHGWPNLFQSGGAQVQVKTTIEKFCGLNG